MRNFHILAKEDIWPTVLKTEVSHCDQQSNNPPDDTLIAGARVTLHSRGEFGPQVEGQSLTG